MTRVTITVLAGLVLIAALLAATLSGSPVAVARTNVPATAVILSTQQRTAACQSGEVVPQGTIAVRMHAFAGIGPRVDVKLFQRGKLLAHGQRIAGWAGAVVTVPVGKQERSSTDAKLCFDFQSNGSETLEFAGAAAKGPLAARIRGRPLSGRVSVEYLRRTSSSWWSLLTPTARRMGLGHSGAGTWSVFLTIALVIALSLLSTRVLIRELA